MRRRGRRAALPGAAGAADALHLAAGRARDRRRLRSGQRPERGARPRSIGWPTCCCRSSTTGPTLHALDALIVENAWAIPMHLPLGVALRRMVEERRLPAIGHHHDYWWERERFASCVVPEVLEEAFPPDLPWVRHVSINCLAARAAARPPRHRRRRSSRTCSTSSRPRPRRSPAIRRRLRAELGMNERGLLVVQPTRVVPRKGIELAIELVGRLEDPDAVLLITSPAGDEGLDYLVELERLAERHKVRLRYAADRFAPDHEGKPIRPAHSLHDAYLAADLITYPEPVRGLRQRPAGGALLRRAGASSTAIRCTSPTSRRSACGLIEIDGRDHRRHGQARSAALLAQPTQHPGERAAQLRDRARKHLSYRVLRRQLRRLINEVTATEAIASGRATSSLRALDLDGRVEPRERRQRRAGCFGCLVLPAGAREGLRQRDLGPRSLPACLRRAKVARARRSRSSPSSTSPAASAARPSSRSANGRQRDQTRSCSAHSRAAATIARRLVPRTLRRDELCPRLISQITVLDVANGSASARRSRASANSPRRTSVCTIQRRAPDTPMLPRLAWDRSSSAMSASAAARIPRHLLQVGGDAVQAHRVIRERPVVIDRRVEAGVHRPEPIPVRQAEPGDRMEHVLRPVADGRDTGSGAARLLAHRQLAPRAGSRRCGPAARLRCRRCPRSRQGRPAAG